MVSGVGHFFSFPAMHMRRPRFPVLTTLHMGCIGQGLGTTIGATMTVLADINIAPTAGESTTPRDARTPAASGIATTLYPAAHQRF